MDELFDFLEDVVSPAIVFAAALIVPVYFILLGL